MKKEYPDENELKAIKEWDYLKPLELIEYVRVIWWNPDWGFKLDGNTLELHTGGWSGNEDIIDALMQNEMFWGIYWKESRRGGHHYFDCDMVAPELKWEKK